ncbi:Uncharacterised protein [Bordetella pertussis]|nr:Uncharacterised protein [Bordetella pertussis]
MARYRRAMGSSTPSKADGTSSLLRWTMCCSARNSRSCLSGTYWYIRPALTPASCAMSLTVAAWYPMRENSLIAAFTSCARRRVTREESSTEWGMLGWGSCGAAVGAAVD